MGHEADDVSVYRCRFNERLLKNTISFNYEYSMQKSNKVARALVVQEVETFKPKRSKVSWFEQSDPNHLTCL